jgi:hypothetical protein
MQPTTFAVDIDAGFIGVQQRLVDQVVFDQPF